MPHDVLAVPRVRRSARVLLVDAADRLLLFQTRLDPPDVGNIWFTPGGGVEPGEQLPATAARELAEETGCQVRPEELVGPVWVRRHVGATFDSRETFFLLRIDRHEVDASCWTELERRAFIRHRWWSVPALAAAEDIFAPRRIAALLPAVLAGWSGPALEVGT